MRSSHRALGPVVFSPSLLLLEADEEVCSKGRAVFSLRSSPKSPAGDDARSSGTATLCNLHPTYHLKGCDAGVALPEKRRGEGLREHRVPLRRRIKGDERISALYQRARG